MTSATIGIENLSKTFGRNVRALDDVSLQISAGEMVALIGSSGSGKSTLMRHLAGLVSGDRSGGRIEVAGHQIQAGGRISSRIRAARGDIAFIFQQFNLVGRLSVITNVLAGGLRRTPPWRSLFRIFTAAERAAALQALARVGIAERAWQRASTLSGGQQQRAAIARAMVQGAPVVLADEPIASLDPESARRVMELLAQINREDGKTVVVSLHQVGFALRYCPRIVALNKGKVVFDGPAADLSTERLQQIYGADSDLDFGDAEPNIVTTARPVRPARIPALAEAMAG